MYLIMGVLSAIGIMIVGFLGHVIAHDFCERAPTLARWLLSIAIKWLTPNLRERYSEEWAAHLADCEGILGKLTHAFGCLWCARRLRRRELTSVTLRVAFDLP